jgi:hypothetical protein
MVKAGRCWALGEVPPLLIPPSTHRNKRVPSMSRPCSLSYCEQSDTKAIQTQRFLENPWLCQANSTDMSKGQPSILRAEAEQEDSVSSARKG